MRAPHIRALRAFLSSHCVGKNVERVLGPPDRPHRFDLDLKRGSRSDPICIDTFIYLTVYISLYSGNSIVVFIWIVVYDVELHG
jgi:hypothetical protein